MSGLARGAYLAVGLDSGNGRCYPGEPGPLGAAPIRMGPPCHPLRDFLPPPCSSSLSTRQP